MKRINFFISIAAALILATALAWSQAAAADSSLLRTTFPSPENPGPPFYARISDIPPHFFVDGEWAAIYFYRNPSCVPAGFNLLLFFDIPRAFACQLEVHGFDLWEVEPFSAPPKTEISSGNGAVPVWFVPVDVLNQAAQDSELTIGELAGLEGLLVGTADRFDETHHPSPLPPELGGGGHPNPRLVMNAQGRLEDGRRFSLHINWRVGKTRLVQIRFR